MTGPGLPSTRNRRMTTDESAITGAWVRARRKAAGLTQEALADRLGYSVDLVRKVERGAVGLSPKLRQALLEHLGGQAAEAPTGTLSFADWLAERRLALDLTQGDLAEEVGCAL